jgi:hypothetical protein
MMRGTREDERRTQGKRKENKARPVSSSGLNVLSRLDRSRVELGGRAWRGVAQCGVACVALGEDVSKLLISSASRLASVK